VHRKQPDVKQSEQSPGTASSKSHVTRFRLPYTLYMMSICVCRRCSPTVSLFTGSNGLIPCHGLPWLAVVCHGLPWLAWPWLAVACRGLPWFAWPFLAVASHGLPWLAWPWLAVVCRGLPGCGLLSLSLTHRERGMSSCSIVSQTGGNTVL
jgi:hypothetical protein